ncbi:MAG TPA: type II secretion system F family protein [Planctomicrobium sp.]|nr:type II secretion system F family protein [Planctomicrobium sp.]
MDIFTTPMDPLFVSVIAFVGVSGLIAAIFMLASKDSSSSVEDRLDQLAGKKSRQTDAPNPNNVTREVLKTDALNGLAQLSHKLLQKIPNLKLLFVQADVSIKPDQFLVIVLGSAAFGLAASIAFNAPIPLYPLSALVCAALPFCWLMFCRGRRFKKFAKQLPDAMELVARALRSGHSLASALKVVVDELPEPISKEFHIAYEEQNLGIPIEQALKNLYVRMPNMDYKFFAMAVAIQRQSGGDLAEILDKIGHIIRERFRILGQVQALTGEGRISGIVLMALPIALFFAVWYLNEEYVMLLFTDELGRKMVGTAIFLQVLGAVSIKKIIDIKV